MPTIVTHRWLWCRSTDSWQRLVPPTTTASTPTLWRAHRTGHQQRTADRRASAASRPRVVARNSLVAVPTPTAHAESWAAGTPTAPAPTSASTRASATELRDPGQPLHPATLGKQLSTLGITTLHARTATIRQLVLQAPPSIVAGMLGYHVVHTEGVAIQAGGTWKHYAPGDHTRPLPQVRTAADALKVAERSNTGVQLATAAQKQELADIAINRLGEHDGSHR